MAQKPLPLQSPYDQMWLCIHAICISVWFDHELASLFTISFMVTSYIANNYVCIECSYTNSQMIKCYLSLNFVLGRSGFLPVLWYISVYSFRSTIKQCRKKMMWLVHWTNYPFVSGKPNKGLFCTHKIDVFINIMDFIWMILLFTFWIFVIMDMKWINHLSTYIV